MEIIGIYVSGLLGILVAAISAWLHVNGKDGSGWAVLATCLIVTSCMRSAS